MSKVTAILTVQFDDPFAPEAEAKRYVSRLAQELAGQFLVPYSPNEYNPLRVSVEIREGDA